MPPITPEEMLRKAKALAHRDDLSPYWEAIEVMRAKGYSWREIADHLNENGIKTDHTKLFRHYQRKFKTMPLTIPTTDEYVSALSDLSEKDRALLRHHYHAHNQTMSWSDPDLEQSIGGQPIELCYGQLHSKLIRTLGVEVPTHQPNGEKAYFQLIGTFSPFGKAVLIMHPALAKALAQMSWINN